MSAAAPPAVPGTPPATAAKPAPSFAKVWPMIQTLVHPRRGMLALGLLLVVVKSVSGLVLPVSIRSVIDDVAGAHRPDKLMPIIAVIVLATLVQAASSFFLTQLLSKEAQRLIAEMRRNVYAHITRLPVGYYDANRTGSLVSRIMTDVEGVRNLIGTGLVEFVGGILTSIIAFVIMIRTQASMTIITTAVMLGFSLILNRAFSTMRPIFRERGKINADVTGRLTESLGAVRTVKGYHAEKREQGVFAEGVKRLLDNVLSTLTAQSIMQLSFSLLLGIVGIIILTVGANEILAGHLKTGALMSYIALQGYLIAPMVQIVNIGTQLTEAIAGLERTQEVLSTRAEDDDPKRTRSLGRVTGDIGFEHVDFAYEKDKPVLRDVSFTSPSGSVTALVGTSGSGKSTIIGLIAAFHAPDQGIVRVDNVDLSTVRLDSYRTQLGVVLQDSFLFAGSIRENVAFSRPDATEAQLLEACRIARVDEFADRFPEGLETIVGERGVKLSGGQRQRVSIARAILADPRILILDEATSSLDSESEAHIQAGLQHLMQGRTTFVIAHRLSTIRRADQILVVEDGRIAERGDHEALYAHQGRYRDLYDRQHGLEKNLFLAPGEGGEPAEV